MGPVNAPKIDSVSPVSGPAAGGTLITIAGEHFQTGAKVSMGGVAASVISVTPTSIGAATPPHVAGKVDVDLTSPDNQRAALPNGFTYI